MAADDAAALQFNFSRVSSHDGQAFAACRPGFPSKQVTGAEVAAWIAYMKEEKGIKRVLSLLGDDEAAEFYPDMSIDDTMRQAFGPAAYARTSVFKPDALAVISAALKAARDAGDAIVIHCSGGEGRASLGR